MNDPDTSQTAIFTAYLRSLLGQRYANEIAELLDCESVIEEVSVDNPDMESRGKFRMGLRGAVVRAAIDGSGLKDIVELGAGFSSYGLSYTDDPSYQYLEIDRYSIIRQKIRIIKRLVGDRPNLILHADNVVDTTAIHDAVGLHLGRGKPVMVVAEGLWPYFNPATNLSDLVWTIVLLLISRPGSTAIITDILVGDEVKQLVANWPTASRVMKLVGLPLDQYALPDLTTAFDLFRDHGLTVEEADLTSHLSPEFRTDPKDEEKILATSRHIIVRSQS